MSNIKLFIPNDSDMGFGGAWTFMDNLKSGLRGFDVEIEQDLNEADISLISGATTVQRDTFKKLKENTKVVLRLDGIPEDWRNRGTGFSRTRDYFLNADAVVYQSEFTANTVGKWMESLDKRDNLKTRIIVNGVNKSIFKTNGTKLSNFGNPSYLHVNSRKDPNKRIEEVIHFFRYEKLINPDATLTLLGKYPTYLREWNFGLYGMEQGEDWQYLGIYKNKKDIAKIMRSCDIFLFPSFADPCPNVLIEAMHCGLEVELLNDTGGQKELYERFHDDYDFSLKNMTAQYVNFFQEVLNE